MSETKSNAYDLAAAGMPPDLVYQAYLEQQGLKEVELNYQAFVDRFYKPGGSDITELRANPRKDAAFGLGKILGALVPASLQDKHRYFDPKKVEAKDYDSFKKGHASHGEFPTSLPWMEPLVPAVERDHDVDDLKAHVRVELGPEENDDVEPHVHDARGPGPHVLPHEQGARELRRRPRSGRAAPASRRPRGSPAYPCRTPAHS